MPTSQKLVYATEIPTEFTQNVANWVSKNSVELNRKFSKQYPRCRNLFNVQVMNKNGSKRVLVLNGLREVKVDTASAYKKHISWASAKKLGCPVK